MYGDLVNKFEGIVRGADFSGRFLGIIVRDGRVGCGLVVMEQSACLVVSLVAIDNFAALINCTPVDRASDSVMAAAWDCLF